MNMVGHRAISNQRHLVELDVLPQQIEIDHAISIAIEDKAPRIATLRHMVRDINGNHAS
jgi:hypothetical protein